MLPIDDAFSLCFMISIASINAEKKNKHIGHVRPDKEGNQTTAGLK